MWEMTEEQFNKKLERIKRKNIQKEYRRKLKAENNICQKQFRLPSTSKLILIGTVLFCLEIVVFCEYAMMRFGDLSAMYALIGVPAAMMPVIWAYYSKARAENTVGGITYELAMKQDEEAKG